ncbi:MAG: PKD domain-containing protein [Candidatus Bathyarchaeia archaeon]|jgi:hypothetical protein
MNQTTKNVVNSLFLLTLLFSTLFTFTQINIEVEAQTKPALSLNPSEINLTQVGETFDVELTVTDVSNLYQWVVKVTWDPTALSIVGDPEEIDFLQSAGQTLFNSAPGPDGELPEVTCSSIAALAAGTGVSGSGALAKFTFKVLKPIVDSPINLEETYLSTPEYEAYSPTMAKLIDHQVITPAKVTLIVGNAPIAEAGDPQTVNEDTPMVFNGSKSVALSGDLTYTWSFLDNELKTLDGITPTYSFELPGIHEVTLTVETTDGESGSDNVTITVLDITKPIAKMTFKQEGAGQSYYAGKEIEFSGAQSYDPEDGRIFSYNWNFGDGHTYSDNTTIKGPIAAEATNIYAQEGTYTVNLTVVDKRANLTGTEIMELTVKPESEFPKTQDSNNVQGLILPPTIIGIIIAITLIVIVGSAAWLLGITNKSKINFS